MASEYQDKFQDGRIGKLEDKMDVVFGHIATTNSEMGAVKTDVAWLKKFFFIISSASIASAIASVLALIFK